jgi:hypothetical protein
MTDAKINFPFPHRELTLIDGHPNPQSLKKLFSEIYDHAFAVKSQAGGGQFGHLGAVMPAAQYIALDGTIAYVTPPDPSIQAPAPAAATAVQITQANCLYDSTVNHFEMHNNVCLELKRMILAAVSDKYVSTLQHPLLRYTKVTVKALLQHLTDTYSEITQAVLENNCSKISAEWNPDDDIETIFTRITDTQQFAAAAGDDHIIPESTAIYLALTAIDNTGVFLEPCADWSKHHLAEQMLANFTADFTHAWKECNRRISAKAAGYQALFTTKEEDKEKISPTMSSKPDVNVDGIKMYYCWSHGLGFNSNHTSCTCRTKKDGHHDDATIRSRKGSSNMIWENNCNKK